MANPRLVANSKDKPVKKVPELRAVPSSAGVNINGETVDFDAYNIDGNNYFKLRDMGEAFDFRVDWDNSTKSIKIDTSLRYIQE